MKTTSITLAEWESLESKPTEFARGRDDAHAYDYAVLDAEDLSVVLAGPFDSLDDARRTATKFARPVDDGEDLHRRQQYSYRENGYRGREMRIVAWPGLVTERGVLPVLPLSVEIDGRRWGPNVNGNTMYRTRVVVDGVTYDLGRGWGGGSMYAQTANIFLRANGFLFNVAAPRQVRREVQ